MSTDEMQQVFAEWNRGKLDSYLIEITRDILAFKDADGQPLVEQDPGRRRAKRAPVKWTVITALDTGIPLTLVAEAVLARSLSAIKEERVAASQAAERPDGQLRRRPRRPSWTTCVKRCTPPRSSPTPRATC